MIKEITIKMYYEIDDEMIETNLLSIQSEKGTEELITDQLTNIYCDDIGFEHIRVTCQDYYDEGACKMMREYIRGLKPKHIWAKSIGVITPGGDPAYECPVCGKGHHVYGVENINHPKYECPDCGANMIYPWEGEDELQK